MSNNHYDPELKEKVLRLYPIPNEALIIRLGADVFQHTESTPSIITIVKASA